MIRGSVLHEDQNSEGYDDFELVAKQVRNHASSLLSFYFGDKCDEYVENCECCRRWKLLDDLLENPFKD